MEIQLSVAKINQYGSLESGDTLEIVERPNGGISVVLADAQSSGKEAKTISNLVVRQVIGLLADGVRDGAAARAASDHLFTERNGMAAAYLNILSADLQTQTLVITRNNPTPLFIAQGERIECLSSESQAIGTSRNIRPAITEFLLEVGTTVVIYTDGLAQAGQRIGLAVDVCTILESLLEDQEPSSQEIADTILSEAVRLEQGQPLDDMSIVVLRVLGHETDRIRRMNVRIPFIWETSSSL